MDPTWFGGADFGMCNVGDQPWHYLLSSRYLVPRSGIQDDMPKPELQQSEPGPDGPPKTTEEDFKQLGKLGSGGYGKVMLVRKTKGEHMNKLFAMKVSEKGFSYVAPSSFDGSPEESGSCQGQQPRPAQVPSGSINHCPAEAIHQIQVVGDHTASSPRFDAHQKATAYPAMSNTPQILPSNLSYNPPISDPVKESHHQRYARMDYTPVAPMFDHHNLVPPPPGFNMVQNPPPEYYNTQQILPSNLSYNPPISDPVKESHGQRYARMDYTTVAPMFSHHNLVPPPPRFNMAQNPPLDNYNAFTRGPFPEPVEVIHDTWDMALDWFSSWSVDQYICLLTCENPAFFVPPPRWAPPCYSDNSHQFSGATNNCLPPDQVFFSCAEYCSGLYMCGGCGLGCHWSE